MVSVFWAGFHVGCLDREGPVLDRPPVQTAQACLTTTAHDKGEPKVEGESHGPFVFYPSGTRTEQITGAVCVPVDTALAAKSIFDPDVPDVASVEELSGELRGAARPPVFLPSELELASVRSLTTQDGKPFQVTLLYYRSKTLDRAPENADLIVTRTLAMQPPVTVIEPEQSRLTEAVRGWTIERIFVNGAHAVFHDFENDPSADRASQQADGIQWFDDEGYFNAVIGWDLSFEVLLQIAESVGQ